LHTLKLSGTEVIDVSPLANCSALRKLDLAQCFHLTNVSPLAGCAALHTPCAARR